MYKRKSVIYTNEINRNIFTSGLELHAMLYMLGIILFSLFKQELPSGHIKLNKLISRLSLKISRLKTPHVSFFQFSS